MNKNLLNLKLLRQTPKFYVYETGYRPDVMCTIYISKAHSASLTGQALPAPSVNVQIETSEA